MSDAAKRRLPPLARVALDLGPLVLFFIVLRLADIFVATGVFMAAILATLAASYALERRVSPMPVITAVVNHTSRTRVTSRSKYSAKPAQTPAILRSPRGRTRRRRETALPIRLPQ